MKCFILVGEPSGDLHASELIKELLSLNKQIEIKGWGGDLMKSAGADILMPLEKLSFMGFWEVIKNIFKIIGLFKTAKSDIKKFNPDVLILVDYPGFNLKMAKWAKKQNLKTYYYISPQLWAWNTKRVNIIKDCIEKIFVIFPFEKKFYKSHGIDAVYIGHPLVGRIEEFKKENLPLNTKKDTILLLPGSRIQEIKKNLPLMIELAKKFETYKFEVGGLSIIPKEIYEKNKIPDHVSIIYGDTYQLLNHSKLAIVTSGTATLETALFGVPQIVVYKSDWFSYQIAKKVIKVPFISIVNLIAGKEIVKELIQQNFNILNLEKEVNKLLQLSNRDYFNPYISQLIDSEGVKRAAQEIILNCEKN